MELIGREREREALRVALAPDGARVALVGPGGAGKTRLAQSLPDAVICELAGCRTREDALERAASALDVDLRGTGDRARLSAALGARALVLDGCEPLLDAVLALLDGWVGGRILITSRVRPARLDVIDLGPLSLPRSDDLDAVLASEAGRLLIDRARRARPGWAPEAEEGPVIAELLRRLDGLPLAIELAAARLRLLGTRQLLALLDARFRLLTGDPGSLEAVLQASWDLLPPADRSLLTSLAWFGGAFDLEAVAALDGVADEIDALERLSALVDHSLIRTWERPRLPGVRWFALYDSVRAFAEARGEPPSQARWVARRGHDLLRALRGPMWSDAAERLTELAPALRRAFDACAEAGDAEHAARAALALDGVLKARGPASARAPLLRATHALGGPLADDVWLAGVELGAFDPDPGELAAVRDRAVDAGQREREAWASRTLARELVVRGDLERARAEAERSARLDPDEPRSLATLAEVLAAGGDREAAVRAHQRAITAARRRGAPRDEASVLALLAMLEHELEHHAEARELATRAIGMLDGLADPRRAAITAQLLGEIALALGEPDEAARSFADARARLEAVGERRWRSYCDAGVALSLARQGQVERAREMLRDALDDARQHDAKRVQGFIACWAATVEASSGHPDEGAARLIGADDSLPQVADGLRVARRAISLAREMSAAPERAGPVAREVLAWLAAADRSRWATEVRVAADELARAAERAADAATEGRFAEDAAWFEVPGQPRVSLATRHANRRVLLRLLDAHAANGSATVEELLESGWPGERVLAEAGAARVYTAIATLRREGLKALIERTETGYAIRAGARIERA